jgi:hypothetical protein
VGLEKNKGVGDSYHDFFQLLRFCRSAVSSFGNFQTGFKIFTGMLKTKLRRVLSSFSFVLGIKHEFDLYCHIQSKWNLQIITLFFFLLSASSELCALIGGLVIANVVRFVAYIRRGNKVHTGAI